MNAINEMERYRDPETGLQVTRWTRHPSNHLYFTNPGWFDGGRQLLFTSDRSGISQLAALDLETGEQRPITDWPEGVAPQRASVDPVADRVATWVRVDGVDRLELIDLKSRKREELHCLPEGWDGIMPNFTADGRRICCGMTERMDLGFGEHFAAKPTSRILAVEADTGAVEVVHERQVWLGHVNPAPNDPDLISFCHEGPWSQVENRVWCLDLTNGCAWKIRPGLTHPACIGHEYWLADGKRIAYHGYNQSPAPVLGIVGVHDGGFVEHVNPTKSKHTHSLDGEIVVGDGSEALPWLLAWRFTAEGLEGPWKLCRHGGGWSEQRRHIHPRLDPDGHRVLFTSDSEGEPRVYTVDLPERLDHAWLLKGGRG